MNTVEDALELIASMHGLPPPYASFEPDAPWKTRFLTSVCKYVKQSKPLSVAQSAMVLKLLSGEDGEFLAESGLCSRAQIDRLIAAPRHRLPPFVSQNNVPREVRYAGENLLAFRFKMNDEIVNKLKQLSTKHTHPPVSRSWFHGEHRVWMVPVLHSSLSSIKQLISQYEFNFDEEVAQYLTDATNSLDQDCTFVLAEHCNLIAAHVPDNDVIAWWTRNILHGEVV